MNIKLNVGFPTLLIFILAIAFLIDFAVNLRGVSLGMAVFLWTCGVFVQMLDTLEKVEGE